MLQIEAVNLAAALLQLAHHCPTMKPAVLNAAGLLSRHYLVAINGLHFTDDLAAPLAAGDVLVVITAQAGG